MTPLEKQLEINKERFETLSPKVYSEQAKQSIVRLGSSYRALGLWENALWAFDIGFSLSQKANNIEGKAEFLIWKSNVYYHMGRYGRSIEFATRSIGLGISDSSRAERISYYLANPYLMLGDIERYIALQEQALEITEKLSEQLQENLKPWILCRLAMGLDRIGDSAKANQIIVKQVDRLKNLKQVYGIPFSLLILGKNLLQLEKLTEAKQALTVALKLYEKNNQEGFVVDALVELSKVALAMGNCKEAKLHINRAIEEARKGPRKREGLADKRHLNQALIQAAKVYLQSKEIDKASNFYKEALDLSVRSNRKLMIIELLQMEESSMDSRQATSSDSSVSFCPEE